MGIIDTGGEGVTEDWVKEYIPVDTSQAYSIAVGENAGANNIKKYQTAFGADAGSSNEGYFQTAVGYEAGANNTSTMQAAFGMRAGKDNTAGQQTALGYLAGKGNEGKSQTVVGCEVGGNNTGDYQTAVGYLAGKSNEGINQVAFGTQAGVSNTGDYNIAIGRYSSMSNTGNNLIAIGYEAGRDNTEDNQFIVQQSNVNDTPLIQGDFATNNLYFNGYTTLGAGAPAIKIMKRVGTTEAAGNITTVLTGLDRDKILAVNVLVDVGTESIPPFYTLVTAFSYAYRVRDDGAIRFYVPGTATSIGECPYTCLITYEE